MSCPNAALHAGGCCYCCCCRLACQGLALRPQQDVDHPGQSVVVVGVAPQAAGRGVRWDRKVLRAATWGGSRSLRPGGSPPRDRAPAAAAAAPRAWTRPRPRPGPGPGLREACTQPATSGARGTGRYSHAGQQDEEEGSLFTCWPAGRGVGLTFLPTLCPPAPPPVPPQPPTSQQAPTPDPGARQPRPTPAPGVGHITLGRGRRTPEPRPRKRAVRRRTPEPSPRKRAVRQRCRSARPWRCSSSYTGPVGRHAGWLCWRRQGQGSSPAQGARRRRRRRPR